MKNYNKAVNWDGKDVNTPVLISYKVDGVRALKVDGMWVSRNNKPLYNLDGLPDGYEDIEVFSTDWSTSVSLCRTKKGMPVKESDVFSLHPKLDRRLMVAHRDSMSAGEIEEELHKARAKGYEGLVLRTADKWIKVKHKETYDVEVIGTLPGYGKHAGKMGALVTRMGHVGTGFTDKQRELFQVKTPNIIEVECMELTPSGMFRHPRFIRERWDK